MSIIAWFDGNESYNYLPEVCVAPHQQNVDVPKTYSFEKLLHEARLEVHKCDLYVFKNSACGKELYLFASTAREVPETYEDDLDDLYVLTLTTF